MEISNPAGPGRLASASAPVVAMSGQDAASSVVLYPACDGAECSLRESRLAPNGDLARSVAPGSAVLVTSAGNWVVAIDWSTGKVHTWNIHQGELVPGVDLDSQHKIRRLVAGMRGSDSVLVRDDTGRLFLWHAGTKAPPRRLADASTYVVAVGQRYVVTRTIVDGTENNIQILDTQGWSHDLLPVSHLARVAISPGDTHVALTVGEEPETLVFDTPTMTLRDQFFGALAAGRADLEDIPGLASFSADGTRLAYQTSRGALAIRDVETAGSCLVRSSTEGQHAIAGFAASGILYAESHEGRYAQSDRTRVLAFDPATRRLTALGPAREKFHLSAVPARPDELGVGPWAVGVANGEYSGLAEGDSFTRLRLDEVAFLARDTAQVWAVETMPSAADASNRTLTVRSIVPTPTPDGAITFATAGPLAHPHHFSPETGGELVDMGPFNHVLDGSQRVCLSTGVPGGWAYRCGRAAETSFLGTRGTPHSEDPTKEQPEPEIPAEPDPDPEPDEG